MADCTAVKRACTAIWLGSACLPAWSRPCTKQQLWRTASEALNAICSQYHEQPATQKGARVAVHRLEKAQGGVHLSELQRPHARAERRACRLHSQSS